MRQPIQTDIKTGIRLIRIYNPATRRVQSFLSKKDSCTVGSGPTADIRVYMPSLNWIHLTVDFVGSKILPAGSDILVDGSRVGVDPFSFAEGSVVVVRSLVLGLYSTFESPESRIEELLREGERRSGPVDTDTSDVIGVPTNRERTTVPSYPPGFEISPSSAATDPIVEVNECRDGEALPSQYRENIGASEAVPLGDSYISTLADDVVDNAMKETGEFEDGQMTGEITNKVPEHIKTNERRRAMDGELSKRVKEEMEANSEAIKANMKESYEAGTGAVSGLAPIPYEGPMKKIKKNVSVNSETSTNSVDEDVLSRSSGSVGGISGKIIEEARQEIKDSFHVEPEPEMIEALLEKRLENTNEDIKGLINKDFNTTVKKPEQGDLGRTMVDKAILEDVKQEIHSAIESDNSLHIPEGPATHEAESEQKKEPEEPEAASPIADSGLARKELKKDIGKTVASTVQRKVKKDVDRAVKETIQETGLADKIAEKVGEKTEKAEKAEKEVPASRKAPARGQEEHPKKAKKEEYSQAPSSEAATEEEEEKPPKKEKQTHAKEAVKLRSKTKEQPTPSKAKAAVTKETAKPAKAVASRPASKPAQPKPKSEAAVEPPQKETRKASASVKKAPKDGNARPKRAAATSQKPNASKKTSK